MKNKRKACWLVNDPSSLIPIKNITSVLNQIGREKTPIENPSQRGWLPNMNGTQFQGTCLYKTVLRSTLFRFV